MISATAIIVTLIVEALIYGGGRFVQTLRQPSRRARLNLR